MYNQCVNSIKNNLSVEFSLHEQARRVIKLCTHTILESLP